MQNKSDLLESLQALLLSGTAGTQEEICANLERQGYEVNQSKVSRLLRKIGAVKAKNEYGQVVYRLPKEPAPPAPSSHLAGLVVSIRANEVAVVIHTSPGSASLIARMLDHHRERLGILGTIAGDDTILILPDAIQALPELLHAVKRLLLSGEYQ